MRLKLRTSTIITFVIVLALGGLSLVQRMKSDAQPPVVEHSVQGTTPRGIAPVPEFLLRHQADIGLTAEQVERIRTIASAYRRDVAPYQERVQAASAHYRKQMEPATENTRHKLQEIENGGRDIRQLSSILAATRQSYWQRARTVLTLEQQAKADHLVAKVTLQDLQ